MSDQCDRTPFGWEKKRLGDVATLQRGMDLPVQNRMPGEVPVYGSNGVDGFHSDSPLFGPGVITGRSGTIGFVYFCREKYWPLNTTLYVKDFNRNEPRFIFRLLESLRLDRFIAATGVPSLNRNFVHPTNVHVPPLPEQRRIAEILDTVDEAIRATEQLIAKLKQMKQGLLHDLLTRGIDDNGELRDPERHPEQFKDSPLGRIPRGWEVALLGDVLMRGQGLVQTGPFGSQLHAHEYVAEGVPVIMPQDMIEGEVSLDAIARVLPKKANALARHKLKRGDVVFARRGDLGRCVATSTREEGWLCGTGCLRVRPPTTEINAQWLATIYRHDMCQRQILARAVGSTMVNLNTTLLSGLVFALPGLAEQSRIVALDVSQADTITAEGRHLTKLKLLKKGLMEDLLTGRVRVKVDEGEEKSDRA